MAGGQRMSKAKDRGQGTSPLSPQTFPVKKRISSNTLTLESAMGFHVLLCEEAIKSSLPKT